MAPLIERTVAAFEAGDGGLIRVLDQQRFYAFDVTMDTSAFEIAGAGLWTWQRIEMDSLTLTPLDAIPAAGVIAPTYRPRDGRLLPAPPAPDFSSTTFFRVSPSGEVAQSITLPGAALSFFEL